MNPAAFSSPPSSWWVVEFIVSVLAASGGIIVLWGLLWEEYGEKEEYRGVADFRLSKQKAKCGRNILIIGIAWEIILAFGFTGWQAWEIWATGAKNNPLNQPIRSVTASVDLFVEGTNGINVNFKEPFKGFVVLLFGNSQKLTNAWVE